jgi:adenine-specific DNA-methyltransferase
METREILQDIIGDFSPDKFTPLDIPVKDGASRPAGLFLTGFTRFFREKNRSFAPRQESFTRYNDEYFSDGMKLGEIKFSESEKLVVCAFKASQPLPERSGKKAQYEKGKKILKDSQSDAGIFIFYSNSPLKRGGKGVSSFRFSLIYPEYSGTSRQWSYFKRFTYFVSPGLTNKTFLQQIGEGDFSSLKKIKEAFSVEPVTRQFYGELQYWYFWAMDKIKFPDDYKYSNDPAKDKEIRNATNLIRLITRIIFIRFLTEKRLILPELFSREKLVRIVKEFMKGKKASDFYNAVLQNLFFGTLNQKMDERKFAQESGIQTNRKEYGVKNLYRYGDKFLISKDEVLELFNDIPFLNGGLFDCLDKENGAGKVIYADGFSRNPAKQSIIPDYLFFQQEEERVNLSNYGLGAGRPVRGLIEILNSYNFTIDENTPVDQEIALDPELLGKVFENLLASYNPETATTARKATGSYYTPREIVDYMVEESLFEYLKGKLSETEEEKIRMLLSYSEEIPEFSATERKKIISAIDDIKILDPACGSGAFPMGILHKLVYALQKLDPQNKYWHELQYQKALKESREVFKQDDKNERQEKLKEINEAFDEGINYPDYARKLYLIENCIYGVDIQPIAIQISKLRFFISLVLDQKVDRGKENLGIRALPNLETKFVAANTLIGLDKPEQLTFKNPDIEKKEKELKQIRHKYFEAKTRKEKLDYQKKDQQIRKEIADLLKHSGWDTSTAEKIVKFDLYDQNASADFFDPEWMFGISPDSPLTKGDKGGCGGFDVVIANPPYIRAEDLGDLKTYLKVAYTVFASGGDIFSYFYEKSFNILTTHGVFCFINNAFDKTTAGKALREYIAGNCSLKKYVDFKSVGVFEGTTTYPIILLATKSKPQESFEYLKVTDDVFNSFNACQKLDYTFLSISALKQSSWSFDHQGQVALSEKITAHKKLRDVFGKCYRGIITGINDAFITEKDLGNNEYLKPVFEGKDIKKWLTPVIRKQMIVFANKSTCVSFKEHDEIKAFKAMQTAFPAIMDHLKPFAEEARKRCDKGKFWWELRNCAYYNLFAKPKIIFPNLQNANKFAYDISGTYLNAPAVFLPTDAKWLLGILNSKVVWYFLKTICVERSGGFIEVKPQYFEQIPIPPIKDTDKKKLESLVDQILAAKKKDPKADTSALERQVDQMVYKLYDLTSEEIKIIEGNKK